MVKPLMGLDPFLDLFQVANQPSLGYSLVMDNPLQVQL